MFYFHFFLCIFSFLPYYQHWHCLSKNSPVVQVHKTRPLHSVSKKRNLILFHWPDHVKYKDPDKTTFVLWTKEEFDIDRPLYYFTCYIYMILCLWTVKYNSRNDIHTLDIGLLLDFYCIYVIMNFICISVI